jgi:transposase-like protein
MKILHPQGLDCPHGHSLPAAQSPHDRSRTPIVDYRCRECGSVFNVFTDTVWQGTHHDCQIIVLIMRGFAQGVPTKHLAEELGLDRGALLERRDKVQQLAYEHRDTSPLEDEDTEADEMFQNAGEKGEPHDDADDPPRRRANKRPGKGTMDNDRPPVLGTVGRQSGKARLTVEENTQKKTIQPQVEKSIPSQGNFYTDESTAYQGLGSVQRLHGTVCHSKGEYARDDDGDGIREVHCNTLEGLWTGLRNFLRPFRGVHKKKLKYYVAMFEWAHNLKRVTSDFLRTLMIPDFTYLPT